MSFLQKSSSYLCILSFDYIDYIDYRTCPSYILDADRRIRKLRSSPMSRHEEVLDVHGDGQGHAFEGSSALVSVSRAFHSQMRPFSSIACGYTPLTIEEAFFLLDQQLTLQGRKRESIDDGPQSHCRLGLQRILNLDRETHAILAALKV